MQPTFEELVERQSGLDLPYDHPTVYIDMTLRDGTNRREGPYSQWVAQMMVGSGVFIGTDVASLLIVTNPLETFAGVR